MNRMNVLIVSPGYPYKQYNGYVFVKQLVEQFAQAGCDCTVVAPNAPLHTRMICPRRESVEFPGGGSITIYRPNILSFSSLKLFGKPLSWVVRKRAVERVLESLTTPPDVIYGHFWSSGLVAFDYAKGRQIPLFVATGESDIHAMYPYGMDQAAFHNYPRGVVAVSEKNRQESISLGLTTAERCQVFPNGVDTALFRPLPKRESRGLLGIDEEAFVVIFVGKFCERKGADRLSEAIRRTTGRAVHAIFVGEEGEVRPDCPNILHCGPVMHDELPRYLSASDLFVLPTLKEGCCNAIIEAMACGLPVVSSDRDFNDGLLDDTNSIRIDPMNVDQIAAAIMKLRDDDALRATLAAHALERSADFRIEARSEKILHFIRTRMENE